jgi:hypothetical protein
MGGPPNRLAGRLAPPKTTLEATMFIAHQGDSQVPQVMVAKLLKWLRKCGKHKPIL